MSKYYSKETAYVLSIEVVTKYIHSYLVFVIFTLTYMTKMEFSFRYINSINVERSRVVPESLKLYPSYTCIVGR